MALSPLLQKLAVVGAPTGGGPPVVITMSDGSSWQGWNDQPLRDDGTNVFQFRSVGGWLTLDASEIVAVDSWDPSRLTFEELRGTAFALAERIRARSGG